MMVLCQCLIWPTGSGSTSTGPGDWRGREGGLAGDLGENQVRAPHQTPPPLAPLDSLRADTPGEHLLCFGWYQ